MSKSVRRKQGYNIDPSERVFLSMLYQNHKHKTARYIGVGLETLAALLSPEGEVSDKTVDRVKFKLRSLGYIDMETSNASNVK